MIANTLADILASLKKQKIFGFLKIAFGFSVRFFGDFFYAALWLLKLNLNILKSTRMIK